MISTIYIATHKFDLRWTRICVASIRHWYPDIPIVLIKDYYSGSVDTRELDKYYGTTTFATERKLFGWGFSKLEPLFLKERHKFLVLDSDTVFTGPVLDQLNSRNEEFLVDDELPTPEDGYRLYFKLDQVHQFDPDFSPCGRNFNSGQWVGTSGVIDRTDFGAVVSWDSVPPRLLRPESFMPGDQGVLNYVIEKLANQSRLSLARVPLMWWAPRDIDELRMDQLATNSPYNRIIHWAGCKMYKDELPRKDILQFFEEEYYERCLKSAAFRFVRHTLDRTSQKLYHLRLHLVRRLAKLRTSGTAATG